MCPFPPHEGASFRPALSLEPRMCRVQTAAPLRLCLCLRSRLNNWGPFSGFFVSLLWEKDQINTGEELANNYSGWRAAKTVGRLNVSSERARKGLIKQVEAKFQHKTRGTPSVQWMSALPSFRAGIFVATGFILGGCKMKDGWTNAPGHFVNGC